MPGLGPVPLKYFSAALTVVVSANTKYIVIITDLELKIFKTLTLILAAYLLMWTPFHLSMDLFLFAPRSTAIDLTYGWTGIFAFINSAINPFLYAIGNADVKETMLRIITCNLKYRC